MRVDFSDLRVERDQSYWLSDIPFTGVAIHHRDDGTVESEVSYVDGVQQGRFVEFHRNGRIAVEGNIDGGVYEGLCKSWLPDGTLNREETFEYGICTLRRERGPDGGLATTFVLMPGGPNYWLLEAFRQSSFGHRGE